MQQHLFGQPIYFGRVIDPKYPYERCGYIDSDNTVIELPNRHENPLDFYRCLGEEVDEALRATQRTLRAFWHTHTARHPPEPSTFDLDGNPKDVIGIVVHVPTLTFTAYLNGKVLP